MEGSSLASCIRDEGQARGDRPLTRSAEDLADHGLGWRRSLSRGARQRSAVSVAISRLSSDEVCVQFFCAPLHRACLRRRTPLAAQLLESATAMMHIGVVDMLIE